MTGRPPAAIARGPRYGHLPPVAPVDLASPLPRQWAALGDDLRLAYVDRPPLTAHPSGRSPDPVVLVHGLASWTAFWEHQIDAVARDRRLLALDLPGHGASSRPDAPYTMSWYAEVLFRWLDALDLPRVVLAGHSMGGQIAITAALARPERVTGLVLSAPAGIERFTADEAHFLEQFYDEDRAYATPEDEIALSFRELVFGRVDAGVERLLAERVRMRGTEGLAGASRAVARSIAGMLREPVADRLSELRGRTLVVFGAADRMIPHPLLHPAIGGTAAIAREARARIPRATLLVVEGAGHTVHHDAPQLFNRAVAEFLA